MGSLKRLLFLIFTIISFQLFSQSPEKINYQSIVRDLAGNVIQNQPISLRMSILSDSINGTIVYQETFQPTTNNFGLVNIKIGEGIPVIATMSSVDWSNGPFFLESAVDVTGGTNYIVVSTSQFMSVPYALYASESPLDTTQVQNIVNQQTNNFLDSTSIQNMIDSSVLNIDSTLIASWGYIDSNSIMILINNNSLDSTTIQNMIDNSIVNIDSSTVASWGYLDSSTIQILINNSTIDSTTVANWGYLDSITIQNIITQQTNNYLDSTSVQNMIDSSVTNIDSSTVASWGYVDSSSIMILINNNSLDSATIQNMINSSITNVDSSTVASWGYLDSSSIIALISNSNIDSSSVANWGYLDSVSIQNMINNSSVNVDSAMIANFGFVAGPHTIDTDTQIDSTGIANYGFVTSSQVLDSSSVQNMINNSSSNVDSSTVSNWGFVDSSTVINLINQSGYLDSLTIQSMIDSAIGSTTSINSVGNQLLYPDGLNNISPFYLSNDIIVSTSSNGDYWNGTNSQIDSVTYSPPVGKKLYIQTAVMRYFDSPPSWIWYPLLEINGEPIIRGGLGEIYFSNPIIIGSEDTICLRPAELSNGMNYPSAIRGFLIDENIDVAATTSSIKSTGTVSGAVYDQFIVPQNKIFILLNVFTENAPNASYTSLMNSKNQIIYNSNQNLDNWSSGEMRYLTSPMIFESGDTVRGHWESTLNGYLVDSDFFSSIGGSSGSGSNSTIDSTTISNMGFVDSMTVVNMINNSSVLGSFSDYDTINFQWTNFNSNFPEFRRTQRIYAENDALLLFNNYQGTYPNCKVYFYSDLDSSAILGGGIQNPRNIFFENNSDGLTVYTYPIVKGQYWYLEGTTSGCEYNLMNEHIIVNFNNTSSNSGSGSGSNSSIDSSTVANWGFSTDTDTQIDSTGIANLGYVAGPHTIDTDTQIDSAGIANMGYVAGPHTIDTDTQIDSAGIANLGFVAGPHTVDTDTQIDSAGIAALGYVAGPHTIDTDTQIDSAGIAAMGYLDSVSIRNMIDSAVASNNSASTILSAKTIHWPEGYHGDVMAINFDAINNSYIVPSGKNLYLTGNTPITTNFQNSWEDSARFLINNANYECDIAQYAHLVINSGIPIIAGSNDTVKTEHIQSMTIFGLLIDSMVEIINHNFMENGNFTVPSGKKLFFNPSQSIVGISINGKQINQLEYFASNIPPKYSIAKGGDILTHSGDPNSYPTGCLKMNGYLVDEDYFKTESSSSSSNSGSGSNANTLIFTTNGF